MPFFYLDTSALLKRYHEEAGSDFINALYDYQRHWQRKFFTSVLSGTEFCSAIYRHQREKTFSIESAKGIIYAFLKDSESMLLTIPVDNRIISLSIEILSDHPLRAYDSIQLASSIAAKDCLSIDEDFFFVCDDERLCNSAYNVGLKVLNPRFSKLPV